MKDENVDYKEMYLKMVRATEQAIRILTDAQRNCEEMYIEGCGPISLMQKMEQVAQCDNDRIDIPK